jgi:DNA repair exonuclease SbcCD ATPase subunit
MNKFVTALSTTIVIMVIVTGFLFHQLDAIQNLNSEQRRKNAEIQNRLDELQIQNAELENQITELQTLDSELQNLNSELQNQISEQEKQLRKCTNSVKITDVRIESGIHPYIGLTLYNAAEVTIENIGINDVKGLTLKIEHSSASEGQTRSLDVLRSGEEREIHCALFSVVGVTGWVTVTLKLGVVTIDEYIIPRFPHAG